MVIYYIEHALCLFFLPNFPGPMFISCPTSIPDSRVFHSPAQATGHSPQPKIDFPYHEISGPDICSLICDVLICTYMKTKLSTSTDLTQKPLFFKDLD